MNYIVLLVCVHKWVKFRVTLDTWIFISKGQHISQRIRERIMGTIKH